MTTATHTSTDQSWINGTTTYWFDYKGETLGVVESERNISQYVDSDGYPINPTPEGCHTICLAATTSEPYGTGETVNMDSTFVVTEEMRLAA